MLSKDDLQQWCQVVIGISAKGQPRCIDLMHVIDMMHVIGILLGQARCKGIGQMQYQIQAGSKVGKVLAR